MWSNLNASAAAECHGTSPLENSWEFLVKHMPIPEAIHPGEMCPPTDTLRRLTAALFINTPKPGTAQMTVKRRKE